LRSIGIAGQEENYAGVLLVGDGGRREKQ